VNGTGTGTVTTTLTGLSPNTSYSVVVRARDTSNNQDTNVVEMTKKTLVSFSTNIYTPIVNTICIACHAPGQMADFMDLTVGASAVVTTKWVNVNPAANASGTLMNSVCGTPLPASFKRVVPNDTTNSLVWRKLNDTTPPCGVRMPEGGPFLSAPQIQLFTDWINQGATNN
jgi:hypothetical protein